MSISGITISTVFHHFLSQYKAGQKNQLKFYVLQRRRCLKSSLSRYCIVYVRQNCWQILLEITFHRVQTKCWKSTLQNYCIVAKFELVYTVVVFRGSLAGYCLLCSALCGQNRSRFVKSFYCSCKFAGRWCESQLQCCSADNCCISAAPGRTIMQHCSSPDAVGANLYLI